jgi:hypothetical protein
MTTAAQTIDELVLDHDALAKMNDEQLEAFLDSQQSVEGDTASEDAPELTNDQPIDGVATKDGKNIIPFAVLDATRANLSKAEAQAHAEAQARIEAEAKVNELNERIAALEAGQVEGSAIEALSEEELAAIEEEMPAVAQTLREQQAAIAKLNDQLKIQSQETQAAKAETLVSVVQLAIDANPKLAFLQTQDAKAYEAAKRIDRTLRDDPEFADLSLEERFGKVIERYEEAYGEVKLATKAELQIKEATQKALEKADEVKSVPKTISDIQGGLPPAVDEQAAIADKSGTELTEMFSKMTPAQIENYLNKL